MNKAIILAGGTGTRMGTDIPKQYIEIKGRAIITYCLEKFERNEKIDQIYIAANENRHGYISEQCSKFLTDEFEQKFCGFTAPGATRQLTIFNALEKIKESSSEEDNVIIHDAARPLVSDNLISECIEKLSEYDGAMPVLPMKDTVYFSRNMSEIELLDRKCLYAGQAPEAFKFGKYYRANLSLMPKKILSVNGSSEAAILGGMNIAMIDGDENNFKITTAADLEKFRMKCEE